MAKMDGLSKLDPAVKAKLKGMYFRYEIYTSEQYLDHITHADTDLLAAQSNGYRRMSANLYKTKNFRGVFHIHGSLEASTTTLNMIGLEGHRPDLTDYEDIIKVIEIHVQKYSAAELEEMNKERRQAGVTAYKYEDFIRSRERTMQTWRWCGQSQSSRGWRIGSCGLAARMVRIGLCGRIFGSRRGMLGSASRFLSALLI